ncbi:phosphatidylglycerophosphatase A, partial [Candidatus Desantisbacteria bacterium]|nr:phosphatidylglycerophosphatase A [Candidatus Desantisbacteria bacterium]
MKNLAVFLATGFYSGYFPIFPGTAGTLVGIVIYFLLMKLFNNLYIYIGICFLFFITGYMTVSYCEDFFGRKDPSQIVIDEITGYLITMF